MFFLLRMAFWIGLVLVLLPTDHGTDSTAGTDDKQAQVNAGDALSAASAAVSDMSQFCSRQPTACAVGGQAANVIGQRAQAGARKLYHMITDKDQSKEQPKDQPKAAVKEQPKADKKAPDHTGSIGPADTAEAQRTETPDTLLPTDLEIDWNAPAAPAAAPETTPAS